MAGAAKQRVSRLERWRRGAAIVDGKNVAVEEGVAGARLHVEHPHPPAQRRCELQPARARVRDVVGAKVARLLEAPDGDDQVIERVAEQRRCDQRVPGREHLVDARLDAAAPFRLQRWIVGEGNLERVGRTNPASRGRAQLRRTRRARANIPGGSDPRVRRDHAIRVKRGTRAERLRDARKWIAPDVFDAKTGRHEHAIGRAPAPLPK